MRFKPRVRGHFGAITRYQALRFGLDWGFMSPGLGLGLVASLCGAVRAASMRLTWFTPDRGLKNIRHERRCCRPSLSLHAGLGYATGNFQCTNAWWVIPKLHENMILGSILSETETGQKTFTLSENKQTARSGSYSMVGLKAERLNLILRSVESKSMQHFDLLSVS